jgi:photosystem II stability/assembly factor-like uncharacterized protein
MPKVLRMRTSIAGLVAVILMSISSPAHPATALRDEGRWVPTLPVAPYGWTYSELFDSGVGYVSTGAGELLKTTDAGMTWLPTVDPEVTGNTLRMSFATPRLGYVAEQMGGITKTEDGAATWSQLPLLPTPRGLVPQGGIIDGLEAAPRSDRVVVTGWAWPEPGQDPGRSDHFIWRSSNGGRDWRRMDLSFPASAIEVEFLDDKDGLLLLHQFRVEEDTGNAEVWRTYRSVVLRTRDGGRTFKKIHVLEFASGDAVTAVASTHGDRVWLGTKNGRILKSTDGGRTFRQAARLSTSAPGVPARLDALEFSTRDVGYAGTNGFGVWRTGDGGRTWTRELSPYEVQGDDDTTMSWRGSIAATGVSRAIAVGPGAVSHRVLD